MNRNYSLLLLLASTILTGCDPNVKPPVSWVKAEVSWDGATAEAIAELLPSFAPSLKIAIVEDGLATVYFDGQLAAVETEWESTRDVVPLGFEIRSIEAIASGAPVPPESIRVPRVQFNPDRDRMAALGITLADLMAEIRESVDSASTNEDLDQFRSMQVKAADGTMVPVLELGSLEAVKAERPIVLFR